MEKITANKVTITRGKKGVKNISFDMPMKDWIIFKLLHLKSSIYSSNEINIKDADVKKLLEYIENTIALFNANIGVIDFDNNKPSEVVDGVLKYSLKYSLVNVADDNKEKILVKINEALSNQAFSEIINLYLNPDAEKEYSNHSKLSKHLINQFFQTKNTPTLFSDEVLEDHIKKTETKLNNRPDKFGIELNKSQLMVFEGIVKAFSNKNYKGDASVMVDEKFLREASGGKLRKDVSTIYDNIPEIPLIRITQAELIRLSGFSTTHGDKVDVINALQYLATNQFCFYWRRLKKNSKGIPTKDKKGDFELEEVMEVGTLLRVKTIKNNEGIFQYYEVQPSPVMVDQLESHFLLLPNNWRDEVKSITGKTASSYTYLFLLWLRNEFEKIRSNNLSKYNENKKPKPFIIKKSWSDIAFSLAMPESLYKRNRSRAEKIIKEAYDVAIKIGYLNKVDTSGGADTLFLNENYYVNKGKLK
jgi:hypothetical protein